MAAYFIMNNRIYQSPDLYTVLSNRLVSPLVIRSAFLTGVQLKLVDVSFVIANLA
jgi:hypothetical protein